MTVALLDADIVAYRAAAASEKDIPWGDGEAGKTTSPEAAAISAVDLARRWMRKVDATSAIACFSPREGGNFRKALSKTYKANRKGEKPLAYVAAVEALEREFKAVRFDGMEADDVLGILSTNGTIPTPIIVTIDKDLQGVPGYYFNPTKDRRPRLIKPHMADFFWLYQALIGDSIDGYKGCPGVGPVKAKAILTEGGITLEGKWREVERAFTDRGLTVDDALLQARLARILRVGDYDQPNKRIKLWHPNPAKLEYLDVAASLSRSTPPRSKAASRKSRAS